MVGGREGTVRRILITEDDHRAAAFLGSFIIDFAVGTLRGKIDHEQIATVRGVGYRCTRVPIRTDQDAFLRADHGGGWRSLTDDAYMSTYSWPESSIKEYMISSTIDRSTNRSPARPA